MSATISPGLGPWAANLQQASWRGNAFAVKTSTLRRGRRVAVHEYPERDTVWVEDLGRGTRTISFSGFLIGDDVFDQRTAMLAAAETAGPGTLVHPSLGTVQASLTDFSAGERADLGRVVELEFSFIQTGQDQPLYPSAAASTQDASLTAADTCDEDCGSDFISDVADALAYGETVVQGVVATAVGFVGTIIGTAQAVVMAAEQIISIPEQMLGAALSTVGQVIGLVNDAAIATGAVLGLAGYFGRYGSSGLTAALPASATVASQLASVTANRAAVTAAAGALLTAGATAPDTLPAAVQACVVALAATIPSPSDQLRILAQLAGYQAAPLTSSAPIGAAIAAAQTAAAALMRRAALAALARASAAYQPTSYNDAVAQIIAITGLLDAEAQIAADAGDSASYEALRGARTAVTADLVARGAGLPQLVTVTRARPLSALVLAWQLYTDATRADQLVTEADPINALFMPTSFAALAS